MCNLTKKLQVKIENYLLIFQPNDNNVLFYYYIKKLPDNVGRCKI